MRTRTIAARSGALLLAAACGGLLGIAGCGGGDSSKSDVREQAEELIRSDLEESTPPSELDCIIDGLPDYSDAEYQEIIDSYAKRGGAPDIAADVGSAAVDCASS